MKLNEFKGFFKDLQSNIQKRAYTTEYFKEAYGLITEHVESMKEAHAVLQVRALSDQLIEAGKPGVPIPPAIPRTPINDEESAALPALKETARKWEEGTITDTEYTQIIDAYEEADTRYWKRFTVNNAYNNARSKLIEESIENDRKQIREIIAGLDRNYTQPRKLLEGLRYRLLFYI